jgi:hypothetical protein
MNCITQQSYALVGISLGSLKGVMHGLLSLKDTIAWVTIFKKNKLVTLKIRLNIL